MHILENVELILRSVEMHDEKLEKCKQELAE